MPTVKVCKAQAIGNQQVPSFEIIIDAELPEFTTLDDQDQFCMIEATRLEEALHNSLPGGTYDRLLAVMLMRKATHFRVPHTS